MSEQLKELIEKINQEGVQKASAKAKEIEAEARKEAQAIIARAQQEAQQMIVNAQQESARITEREKSALVQAGRDMLLSVRQEINDMLTRLVTAGVRQTLTAHEMARMLLGMITTALSHKDASILVSAKKEDIEVLQRELLGMLKDEVRTQVVLKPSGEITGGFAISFDAGKSRYDFTDVALAEYIGAYLKPQLDQILQSAAR